MKHLFPALLAIVFGTGCATPGTREFRVMDANHDQAVSAEEFYAHVSGEAFQRLDANQDGRIKRSEWLAKETEPTSGSLFDSLDADHNGAISQTEFIQSDAKRAEVGRIFATVDRNHDGRVQWGELLSK